MASRKLSCFLPSLIVIVLSQSFLLLGAPLEHLVSELPEQPSAEFKQYSGYITVDEAKGTNFFYYFVEAEANASSLPITLWLNGARENLAFVRKWFQLFPEYTSHQLFLTGESYAGHYIPQLAWLMMMCKEFNLNGILMGNPLLNYGMDTSATYSFLWSHGVISDETFHGVSRWCDFRYGYMGGEVAIEYYEERREGKKGGCTSFLASARNEMGSYINIYDVTADVCPPPILHQAILLQKLMGVAGGKEATDVCIDHEITRYLNKPDVQKALHANLTSLPYPWEACSRIVNYNATDQLADMIPLLARLAKNGLPVWIFSGDQDSVVPLTGTRTQIARLAQRLKLKPKGPYQPWYARGQVGGWWEAYGNESLVYATVRGASHMVPYAQPERALVLFSRFIHGKLLPSRP
ncbi:Carboxypeptidase [Cocos nucifera]|nr:Carboxypeptidase [Cocos nucifera]